MPKYHSLLTDLGMDALSVAMVAMVLYRRRYGRRDQAVAYVAVNLVMFLTLWLTTLVDHQLKAGFGVFAVLALIHLRSRPAAQGEVSYYFAVLVLGVVNGVNLPDWHLAALLDAVIVGTLTVADSRRLFPACQRRTVILDTIPDDDTDLLLHLERRLRAPVLRHIVEEIDYVRGTVVVDARYRPPR